jgi:anion-transporting  ArsA/GET3 family ATPase
MSFASLIETHRIVVCVGTGGVGKTTVAASLALQGALRGRRAMVLTIDPARRLAQSLGLDDWREGRQQINLGEVGSAGVAGSLDAGMLDQKSAWDEFIGRHAPTEEARDTILANEFYQQMSRSFAGSTEYMAIEELCRIEECGEYDLIVLDTPPTGHALDFLEAPRRLEDFLDRSMMGWFVRPYATIGWSAWKTTSRSMRFLFDRIEKATGVETLRQISEFFVAMDTMFDGISTRSHRVRDVLSGERTAFVLVAGPDERVLEESEALTSKLSELGVRLRGVVLNRLHPLEGEALVEHDRSTLETALDSLLRPPGDLDSSSLPTLVTWLANNHEDAQQRNRAEVERYERFARGFPADVEVRRVKEFDADVHDLAALSEFGEIVIGE